MSNVISLFQNRLDLGLRYPNWSIQACNIFGLTLPNSDALAPGCNVTEWVDILKNDILVKMSLDDCIKQSGMVMFHVKVVEYANRSTNRLSAQLMEKIWEKLEEFNFPPEKFDEWLELTKKDLHTSAFFYRCLCGSEHELVTRKERKTKVLSVLRCTNTKACVWSDVCRIRTDRRRFPSCPLCRLHRRRTVCLTADDLDTGDGEGFGHAFYVCSYCKHILYKIAVWVDAISNTMHLT